MRNFLRSFTRINTGYLIFDSSISVTGRFALEFLQKFNHLIEPTSDSIVERSVAPSVHWIDILDPIFEEELCNIALVLGTSQVEGCPSIIIAEVQIDIALHDEGLDSLKVTQTAEVEEILSHVNLSSSSLSQDLVVIDLEIMEIIVLTDQLAELNTFGAVSVFIESWTISADSHLAWNDNHDGTTDS